MRIAMKTLILLLVVSVAALGQIKANPPNTNHGVGSFLTGTGASLSSYASTFSVSCSAANYALISEEKYSWVSCRIDDWLTDQHFWADARVPRMYVKTTGRSVVIDIPDLKAAWQAAYQGEDDISFYANNGYPEPIAVHLTFVATNDWSQLNSSEFRQRYIDETTGKEVILTGLTDSRASSATAEGTFAGFTLPFINLGDINDASFFTGTFNKNHTAP